jgi:hypothetical protein
MRAEMGRKSFKNDGLKDWGTRKVRHKVVSTEFDYQKIIKAMPVAVDNKYNLNLLRTGKEE